MKTNRSASPIRLCALAVLVLFSLSAVAEDDPAEAPLDEAAEAPAETAAPEVFGKIAENDLVVIGVTGLQGDGFETAWTQRVDADGRIGMVWLEPLAVAGMTTAEAETQIKKAYDRVGLTPVDFASVRRL